MNVSNFTTASDIKEKINQHELDIENLNQVNKINFVHVAQGADYSKHAIKIIDERSGKYYSTIQSILASNLKAMSIKFYEEKIHELTKEFEALK